MNKPIPFFLSHLPVVRGYVVPFFVKWFDGKPDLRVSDEEKRSLCAVQKLCWICGKRIRYPEQFHFIGGPVALHNGVYADGPMHEQCALYSLEICPYLSDPSAQRHEKGLDEKGVKVLPGSIEQRPERIALVAVEHYSWSQLVPGCWYYVIEIPSKVTWFQGGKETGEFP